VLSRMVQPNGTVYVARSKVSFFCANDATVRESKKSVITIFISVRLVVRDLNITNIVLVLVATATHHLKGNAMLRFIRLF
jgi:hypothetical protein